MIAYSRGKRYNDNCPEQRTAANSTEFFNAILQDRAPTKYRQYICAPLTKGYHNDCVRWKGEKTWRIGVLALPRCWLPLDLDGIPGPVAFEELRDILSNHRCLIYTTHSHTEDEPRCRVVLMLDRGVDKDESRALGKTVAENLKTRLRKHGELKDDPSVYGLEQQNYLPEKKAQHWIYEGAPLVVDDIIDTDSIHNPVVHTKPRELAVELGPFTFQRSIIESTLESNGYENKAYNRWLYPRSTTGVAGVRIYEDEDRVRVWSDHADDPLAEPDNNGCKRPADVVRLLALLYAEGDCYSASEYYQRKLEQAGHYDESLLTDNRKVQDSVQNFEKTTGCHKHD